MKLSKNLNLSVLILSIPYLQINKMSEIQTKVSGFRHNTKIVYFLLSVLKDIKKGKSIKYPIITILAERNKINALKFEGGSI